uniref:Transmembrane protein 42a n=1 Tax=Lates calcarifer TaxID=8187 RepID=A0A4W6C809_LATCA
MFSGSFYAVLAGFLSAAASLSAKLSLGLLLTCNAVMWTFFSKALRHCSSSARATVTTTAFNFISSAILGKVIFGETHAALWWVGISLTLCGLLVLHRSTPDTLPHKESKKNK